MLVFIFANPGGDNSGVAFTASIMVLVPCDLAWASWRYLAGLTVKRETPHKLVLNDAVRRICKSCGEPSDLTKYPRRYLISGLPWQTLTRIYASG